jgi:hypothetical protein
VPVEQLAAGLLENFQGQSSRPRGEIEYAHECPCFEDFREL